MRARLKALGRLAALYEVVEHANGISLDQARASLQEVETRISERQATVSRLLFASQQALQAGDLSGWLLDQSQIEFTQWNRTALQSVQLTREIALREAAAIYQASRMQSEQLSSVLHEVRSAVEVERDREDQRASDDRYLSRQRWLESAGGVATGGPEGDTKGLTPLAPEEDVTTTTPMNLS